MYNQLAITIDTILWKLNGQGTKIPTLKQVHQTFDQAVMAGGNTTTIQKDIDLTINAFLPAYSEKDKSFYQGWIAGCNKTLPAEASVKFKAPADDAGTSAKRAESSNKNIGNILQTETECIDDLQKEMIGA
ncbi:MAG: hypothetical protein SP1CHLAM54_09190 [Chlamydiia bacterium]|nr:hypothetical protein [Chlamydiia bacterium]MCH9615825.1 hypothetical protein [Chlamydiia bacterium]MCH9628772.1 hypothetical protein [Chlamydiia bacterium]